MVKPVRLYFFDCELVLLPLHQLNLGEAGDAVAHRMRGAGDEFDKAGGHGGEVNRLPFVVVGQPGLADLLPFRPLLTDENIYFLNKAGLGSILIGQQAEAAQSRRFRQFQAEFVRIISSGRSGRRLPAGVGTVVPGGAGRVVGAL